MKEEKKLRPPYATSGPADETINLLRRVTPKKIDSKFVVDNNLSTASNAFRILDLLRWLGISDEEGNLNDEAVQKLKLVGEERDKFLADLIRKAYKDIFDRVDLKSARKEDIINFFLSNYGLGSAPAKYAAALFLHFCEKYGIPMSDELKKKTHLLSLTQKEKTIKRVKIPRAKVLDEQTPEAKEGAVIISVKGKISTNLEAKTKTELDNILKIQLPKIFDALKMFLPEE